MTDTSKFQEEVKKNLDFISKKTSYFTKDPLELLLSAIACSVSLDIKDYIYGKLNDCIPIPHIDEKSLAIFDVSKINFYGGGFVKFEIIILNAKEAIGKENGLKKFVCKMDY